MPARSKSKKTKKAASRSTTSRKSASTSPLFKSYYHKEQDKFHKDHPNSKILLTIFIVLVVVFFIAYFFKTMQVPHAVGY